MVLSPRRLRQSGAGALGVLRRRRSLALAVALGCAAGLTPPGGSVHAAGPAQASSPATAAVGLAVNGAATFDATWQTIHDTLVGEDAKADAEWAALRDEFRPRAAGARTEEAVREVLREMLERLGRSHFDILPAGAVPAAATEGDGTLNAAGDIGVEITPIEGEPVVTRVVASSPAGRAGVRPGWIIDQVSGHDPRLALRSIASSTAGDRNGFRLWAATASLMRGATGSTVSVEFRDPAGGVRTLALTREASEGQLVKLGYLPALAAHLDQRLLTAPGGAAVGYVHFNIWMTPLAPAIDRAVDESRAAPGLVIDLRQNPGGVLTMLMGVSGHFFDTPRSLGTLRTRDSELRLVANPRLVSPDGKRVAPYAGRLAILVDDTSYSASEVFAGGMQAAGRARVFGARTPGGALPALLRKLPNGDVLEYAIADFVTVSGERIEGRGVVPDEPVRRTLASVAAGEDPVLDAAVRWAGGGGK